MFSSLSRGLRPGFFDSCSAKRSRLSRLQVEQLEPRAMMAVDAILHWNEIALDVVADDHTFADLKEQVGPTAASRALAIVYVAMFDAINSIHGKYEPYLVKVVGTSGADVDAAVGQAAHDTLAALYPGQSVAIDSALADWLDDVPNGKAEDLGVALGKTVAQAILAQREDDGASAPHNYEYHVGVMGHHQTDPVTFELTGVEQGLLGPQWGDVDPFGIRNTDNFLPPPPPGMNSAEYTAAYQELLRLGGDGVTSPTQRTAEQTEIGIFWAYDGTQGLCASAAALQPDRRSHRPAAAACPNTKTPGCLPWSTSPWPTPASWAGPANTSTTFGGRSWASGPASRTAIRTRRAFPTGGRSALPASNETFPNDFTPPFPAYVSGHAIFGAALFQTLTRFFGRDNIAFSFTSDEFNGTTTNNNGVVRDEVTRHYTSFSQASLENGLSRIYLGIHWRFDIEQGIAAGNRIANDIFGRILQPLSGLCPPARPAATWSRRSPYRKRPPRSCG